ncbi:hypothetical protein GCM10028794_08670 [Silanimonas algicola]
MTAPYRPMPMRAALLLALALLAGAGTRPAEASGNDGTDPALQREMSRLFELRTREPRAFVDGVRALESQPEPASLDQREHLQYLQAYRLALEGRFHDAIGLAKPLAESAQDRALRLRASAYVVNLRAGTRDFEAGLRELGQVLNDIAALDPASDAGLRDGIAEVWRAAAVLYSELDQHALARWYAQRLIDELPDPRNTCSAAILIAKARRVTADPSLRAEDFLAVDAVCAGANESTLLKAFNTIEHVRFLGDRGESDAAMRLLEARLDGIERTRYPRLVAEALAIDAELQFADGRAAQAERQALRAIETSKDNPTSLPVAMAEEVLYEIHRQRGDTSAALRHLQGYITASRALAAESRTKERAFRTVQHETLQREQALALATERNRVLELEARLAKAESRNAVVVATVLVLTLAGLVLWARRLWREASRFRELAQTDPLTGLATRQHFNEVAAALLARGRAEGVPLMLVTFDLDHFKQVNDRHGHLAGDAVLRAVSGAVRAVPAPLPAVIGRIGGEEFAVLLDGATPPEAAGYAEALRQAIATTRVAVDGGAVLAVTASFGLTGTHECERELSALLDRCDRALYRAKHNGRDRVAGPTLPREAA